MVLQRRLARGFTLTELLYVLLAIGVLAAIAIPNFMANQELARDAHTRANTRTVYATLESFRVAHHDSITFDPVVIESLLPSSCENIWPGESERVVYCPNGELRHRRFNRGVVIITEEINAAGRVAANGYALRGMGAKGLLDLELSSP